MPRLMNINHRIGYAIEVTTPYAGPLPKEPGDGGLVVTSIAVAADRCEPGEILRVVVGNTLGFSWPVAHLIARYRRFCALAGPPELAAIARAMMAFCERPIDESSDPAILGEVLRSLGSAFVQLMGAPGLALDRAILIDGSEQFRVETDQGSPLLVLLAGLRSVAYRPPPSASAFVGG